MKGFVPLPFAVEANQKDTLSVLRHIVARIDNLVGDFIIQFLERFEDYTKCISPVMRRQVLHVFEKEGPRAMRFQNFCDAKEQRSLGPVAKAVLASETLLF